ncbi:uncharacterized protein LOC113225504 [Hyposmocoma kahamanoa]|uniref:uncharacterized protein LOC113225504 n=1 Tax=Hyposmocoma kahamanoa TaxID=1477025 RepID=UPI000E6D5D1C|nr:uncharacterized protein LOC113225504 [Hyposmocoma kahamanoa]
MFYKRLIFAMAAACMAAPVDEPVRVDLPVYDSPQAASGVKLAEPLHPENRGGEKSNGPLTGHFISQKLHAVSGALGSKFNAGQLGHDEIVGGIFAAPVTTREGALLETEGWGSKTLSAKENLHSIVAGIFQPKPIVDTIREEDKYGNTGDKFYAAGRAIVGGASGVSNLVNSVLEVPGTIFKKITRIATEKLNNLGGKLIGLN